MTYLFQRAPDEIMAMFFDLLGHAREGGRGGGKNLHDAMVCLVALYDRQARVGSVEVERLRRFRRESGDALAAMHAGVAVYVDEALILAEDGRGDDWYELCVRRSVIQSLIEDYWATPVPDLIDPEDVADLDTEMRRVAEMPGPAPDDRVIPAGLPETHWWWRYPRADRG